MKAFPSSATFAAMRNRMAFRRMTRLRALGLFALLAAVAAFGVRTAADYARQRATIAVAATAERTLDAQVQTILGQLEKYRHLPALSARRQDVKRIATDPLANSALAETIADDIVSLSGAIDVGFFTPEGETVATAWAFLAQQTVANNELLAAPMQGRLGRASISGADGRRAYAFSSPIRDGARIGAILVVAAPLESIEQTWALSANPIFAVNRAGQFVAGNLLARSREAEIRSALRDSAPGQPILAESGDGRGFLPFRRHIALMDWSLYVLEPADSIAAPARNAATVAALSVALVLIGLLALISRLQDIRRRRRFERAAALRLERRVRDRTRELRTAQAELVQSAKLAAIGQMSAALSHEYSQPLAAIRTYAANALRFLEKSQLLSVRDNLGRIEALVERMASLSKTLKSFARKPRSDIRDIALAAVVGDAVLLASHRADEAGVAIRVADIPGDLAVRAGQVRLGQVLLNLMSNAIDANLETGAKEIEIDWSAGEDQVSIRIADRGNGIAPEIRERLFDPFFTTKEVGSGLGLGLSIAYNIVQDFGGKLVAADREGGGAEFTVCLARGRQTVNPAVATAAE